MKKIDVTEAIRKLYADEISEKIFDEVKKEIQDGIPEDLSNESITQPNCSLLKTKDP